MNFTDEEHEVRIRKHHTHTPIATITSSSAIAERPRCRVGYLWPKVEDWNWETIFTNNIGLYSTTATYLAIKEIEIGEKTQIRAVRPFKVIQGHPRSSRSVPAL